MEQANVKQEPSEKKKARNEVMFKVFAPRAVDPILMSFDRDTKIGEVADAAREMFKYEAGTYTLQNEKDEILDRNKTLKDEHVDCGDHLELVSTGGGVFLVPPLSTKEFLVNELESTRALCLRKNLDYQWDESSLELLVTLVQKSSNEKFYLLGVFTDYPALPPMWQFVNLDKSNPTQYCNYPKPEGTVFGASIFINANHGPVICVPFNRLAYQEKGGPHGDWGGCTNWKNVNGQMVKAHSMPDMIAVIMRDFSVTNGRFA